MRKYMRKLSKMSKTLEKVLVIILLIIIPLYPKFPLINIPSTYVAIRIEDLVIGLMFLYLLFAYRRKFQQVIKKPISKAYILYIVVGMVSIISAIMITFTVQPLIGILHLLRRVQYIGPFFLGYIAIENKSIKKEFILKTLILVIFLVLTYGLGQKYLNWPIIVTQNREYAKGIALRSIPGGHLNSTFAGHYDLASYMILVVPIFIVFLANNLKLKKNKLVNAVIIITIFFGTWLIGISGSRISTVSYLVAGTVSLLLIRKWKMIPLFIMVSIIIFSFSSSLIARYQRLFEVGEEKFNLIKQKLIYDMESEYFIYAQNEIFPEKRQSLDPTPTPEPVLEDRSTSIRLNIEWPRAIRAFMKNPLLGTGYSSITLATDNDYLRLIGELGFLGFLSFFGIFINLGKKLVFGIKQLGKYSNLEKSFVIGYTSALVGIVINAVFIDIFEASKFAITFWLLSGIIVAIIDSKFVKSKKLY